MEQSDWQVYLFKTTTGAIGPRVSTKQAGFALSLAGASSGDFQLDKTDLPDDEQWMELWDAGVIVTFQDRAVYAGPLINQPKEYIGEIHYGSEDVRALLSRRVLIRESDLDSPSPAKGVIQFKGMSLGTIAQEVVKVAIEKPGGNLPIVFKSKRESAVDDADHQRTYKAFNASNLVVDEVLTKIQEVSNGPDIMFRPKLIDGNSMVWEMYHGTESNHRIAQTLSRVPEFDLTAIAGQSNSLEIVTTGTYMTDRVISVGGGTNEKAVMAVAEDLTRVRKGYPLLEDVTTISDSENKTVVRNHAINHLKQNKKVRKEFTLFVSAYGEYPLGTYWPGDMIHLYTKGWKNLPNGVSKMRLLALSADVGGSMVRLTMQLDDQWE